MRTKVPLSRQRFGSSLQKVQQRTQAANISKSTDPLNVTMMLNMTIFRPCPVSTEALVQALTMMRIFDRVPKNRVDLKHVKSRLKGEVYRILGALGNEHQMTSIYERHPSEHLWDFVWLDGTGTMSLAAELETSMYGDDVLYDFRKLFHAKCPMKLVLFLDSPQHARNVEIRRISMEMIEDAMNSYDGYIPGEEYVILQVCNLKTGCLEAYRYIVPERPGGLHRKLTKIFTHRWTC